MKVRQRHAVVGGLVMVAILAFGTSAQAAPAAPTITVGYDGLNGDLVGPYDPIDNSVWDQPNGTNDGEFTIAIKHARTLTLAALDLRADNGAEWNTTYGDGIWGLGVTTLSSSTLLNDHDSSISIQIGKGRLVLQLHAEDDGSYTSGRLFTVTATFSDASTATGTVTLP